MGRFLYASAIVTLLVACGSSTPQADTSLAAKPLFAAVETPSNQRSQSIGRHAMGCQAGAVALAETGPTWQAMRLSRNRNWGHPILLDYVEDLSAEVANKVRGWNGLYVGDMNQPRGGPMKSGHTSHQSGLDVDIWMLPPDRLDLTRKERENLSSTSIRSKDQKTVNSNWTKGHAKVLELAARDPRVDRIFIAAAAKIEMCKTARPSDKTWLQKIRPFWGHHYHFHVRLKCPADSPECKNQTPTVNALSSGGDGCDQSLQWWVTTALEPADPNAPKPEPRRHPRSYTMDDLPKSCGVVLRSQ